MFDLTGRDDVKSVGLLALATMMRSPGLERPRAEALDERLSLARRERAEQRARPDQVRDHAAVAIRRERGADLG